MNISRRNLLKLGAGATAMLATGVNPLRALAADKKIPIALELYSVRDDCAKDMPGTLKAVAEMGYQGVEFAGYHNHEAKDLRKMLDDNGLKCCGTHAGLPTMMGDAIKQQIEFNQILGNPNLIIPWMSDDYAKSLDTIKKAGEMLNKMAERAKPEGMRVGYHAHGGDFIKVGDKTAWELLGENTSADVVLQMDTGNCLMGGADPVAILKEFPGRAVTVHLKEFGGKRAAPVGEGKVDWRPVFEFCETAGGTQWYIVEQEEYVNSALESAALCVKNLRKMGK
jgi:sugar phosphate isomerase/epimerase